MNEERFPDGTIPCKKCGWPCGMIEPLGYYVCHHPACAEKYRAEELEESYSLLK